MLTLGVGTDKSGKVSQEGEGGEVSEVSNLQGVQEGAEALCAKSGGEANEGQGEKGADRTRPSCTVMLLPPQVTGCSMRAGTRAVSPLCPHIVQLHVTQSHGGTVAHTEQ